MCLITISSLIGTPAAGGTTNITINGTIDQTGRVCNIIEITVVCGGNQTSGTATITGSNWTIAFNLKCSCGNTVDITAKCIDPAGVCSDTNSFPLICCCPSITTIVDIGSCDASRNRLITFKMNINLVAGCPPSIIQWNHGDGTFSPQQTISASGNYSFTHPYNPNNSPYTATLIIVSPAGCPSVSTPVSVPPCQNPCCPTVSINVSIGVCDSNRQIPVTFNNTVAVPSGCLAATVQMDFGDGTLGNVQTGTNFSYSETHIYNPDATYTATLNTILPTGCPLTINTFTLPKCPTNPCKTTFRKWLCPLLEKIFFFSSLISLLLFLIVPCIPDSDVTAAITATAIILAGVAVTAMILMFVFCMKCLPCGWYFLYLGQILLSIGIGALFFIGCCQALLTFALVYIGLGIIFLILWMLNCNKSWCDLLYKILFALWILAGALLFATFTIGCFSSGWYGLFILILAILTAVHSNNCK